MVALARLGMPCGRAPEPVGTQNLGLKHENEVVIPIAGIRTLVPCEMWEGGLFAA